MLQIENYCIDEYSEEEQLSESNQSAYYPNLSKNKNNQPSNLSSMNNLVDHSNNLNTEPNNIRINPGNYLSNKSRIQKEKKKAKKKKKQLETLIKYSKCAYNASICNSVTECILFWFIAYLNRIGSRGAKECKKEFILFYLIYLFFSLCIKIALCVVLAKIIIPISIYLAFAALINIIVLYSFCAFTFKFNQASDEQRFEVRLYHINNPEKEVD